MLAEQPSSWWIHQIIIPALFTLLGAGIGLATGEVRDWCQARRAKKAFLRAIRLELVGLQQQLQASLSEVEDSRARFARNEGAPPQLAGTLRTTVFTTQLGKLADLADPILMEIIRLYSDLPVLEKMIELLNRSGSEHSRDEGIAQLREAALRISSTARVLSEQLSGFLGRIRNLLLKLPDQDS